MRNLREAADRCEEVARGAPIQQVHEACLEYARLISQVYARIIAMRFNAFRAFQRSAAWRLIENCNARAFSAFECLVRLSSLTAMSPNVDVPSVFLSHAGANTAYAQTVSAALLAGDRAIRAFVDVDPENGVRFGEAIDVAVRRGIIGCRIGVVMLTPESVGRAWPVFEWFMFEARVLLRLRENAPFQLLHDVCAPPDSVRWRDLGWPRTAAGNATVWLDVLQRLPLMRPFVHRAIERQSDRQAAQHEHANQVAHIIHQSIDGLVPAFIVPTNYAIISLISKNSDKALDVPAYSNECGARLQQWSYRRGTTNQQFVLIPQDQYYIVVNVHSNKAVDVTGYSIENGAELQQWTITNGSNQQWRFEHVADGFYVITNRHSGKALDVRDYETNNGATIHQWDIHRGANQQWRLIQAN